jgi:hypothetical protein
MAAVQTALGSLRWRLGFVARLMFKLLRRKQRNGKLEAEELNDAIARILSGDLVLEPGDLRLFTDGLFVCGFYSKPESSGVIDEALRLALESISRLAVAVSFREE